MTSTRRSSVNLAFVHMHARMLAARDRVASSGAVRAMSRATALSIALSSDRRRRRSRRVRAAFTLIIGIVLLIGASCRLRAQEWRTVDVARQRMDSSGAGIKVRFGVGSLLLAAITGPYLYHMQLRYDASRAEPRSSWDAASRTATLGMTSNGMRWASGRNTEAANMVLGLSSASPLDLSIELGATESTLDLTGLWLRSLDVRSGASATRIRFTTPSVHPIERIEIETGVAQFTVEQLANSGARIVRVRGGLSLVELDLTGSWQRDMALELDLSLGRGELTVPKALGVRVTTERASSMLSVEGLKKVGDAWESDGFATAERKLAVSVHSSIGALSITRR